MKKFYAINVKGNENYFGENSDLNPHYGFVRLATFDNLTDAVVLYNTITFNRDRFELELFTEIDIEEVSFENGDEPQYKVLGSKKLVKVEDISMPLDDFEAQAKAKYPFIRDICFEEKYVECGIERHHYICWLNFPYASKDSYGGFFSFYTDEEFNNLIKNSIYKFTIDDVLDDCIEYEQYYPDFGYIVGDATYNEAKLKAIKIINKNNKGE